MINKKKENLGIGGGDLYDFLLLLQSYGEFVFWWQYVFVIVYYLLNLFGLG